ncbi:hypothetical protein L6164_026304 [Bauhinia variegata]|uniref:Uncharacterized protein n=1 Tax=Bauhinia variegata TaxID=167791 RepID=A0ACB9LPX2_BAUVA|nr:hypothetical protein L6164_026304 [Bauhinia variegata]
MEMLRKLSSSPPSPIFLLRFILLLLVVSCKVKAGIKLPPNVSVPAVIVFGDSVMDTGNNNYLKTIAKSNFPPYGKDFEGRIPTGRFCNGKTPSDLIVEELGIKEYLPPYLDPKLQSSELLTGVCFASGGSGYDPLTSQISAVLSLSNQEDLFKEYIGKLKGVVGEDRTKFIIGNSVFFVVTGSDDLANTYFLSRVRQLHYDIPSYTDLMVNSATSFLQEIYQLGARRIGVLNVPPIGCLPSQRTSGGGLERKCVEKYNDAAKLFNSKLARNIDSLNQKFSDSRIVYVDIYYPLLDLISNYQKYGYKVADKGCCGTGIIEVALTCNHLDPVCPDVSKYVFWDSYHPTEGTYKKLIIPLIQKYLYKFL